MLRQTIDPLKIVGAFIDLHRNDGQHPRLGLLDLQILLLINEHPESGQLDIVRLVDRSLSTKSIFDKPLSRLLGYGLIERIDRPSAAAKLGEARVVYKLSKDGGELLRRCGRKN